MSESLNEIMPFQSEASTYANQGTASSSLYSSVTIATDKQSSELVEEYRFEDQSFLTPFSEIDYLFYPSKESIISTFTISEEKLFAPQLFAEKIDKTECFIVDEPPLTAADKYLRNCNKYLLTPVGTIIKALQGQAKGELNLSGYRPEPLNLYFLCQALIGPPETNVTHLNLSNNLFEDAACITLSDLMHKSLSLLSLNLSNCNIGPSGVEILADGILLSQSITDLNLSKCNLRDSGGALVAAAVAENEFLKSLNISYNNLHVDTATALQNMLLVNSSLESLNLRWNDLYPEKHASIKIMNGLRKNTYLKCLDLSWNGITGIGFARALARVMRSNNIIMKICLNNNFLSNVEVNTICSGIKQSIGLRELHLGGNIFTMEDFALLVNAIELSPSVRNLSLGEYTYLAESLYKQAVELNRVIQDKDPLDKGITFKGQLLPNPPDPVDFRAIIIDRAKYLAMKPKKKKLRRDMGHFMLILKDLPEEVMKENEFLNLLKKFKARIDDDLVKHFMEEFRERVKIGRKLRKRVGIKQMAEAYLKRHPTEPPPPPKPKKRRGKKKTAANKS